MKICLTIFGEAKLAWTTSISHKIFVFDGQYLLQDQIYFAPGGCTYYMAIAIINILVFVFFF